MAVFPDFAADLNFVPIMKKRPPKRQPYALRGTNICYDVRVFSIIYAYCLCLGRGNNLSPTADKAEWANDDLPE
jgi:hypothetical protein|tara:strand:+ start:242 stop:463 length:222 start_codon:yes stop_codon:yes gene_type:complete